jgi:hypothetical protein
MTISFEDEMRARQAHVDLMNRYAHAMDHRDWPAMKALFTPDAEFGARRVENGHVVESLLIEGPEKTVNFFAPLIESMAASHYLISNHMLELAADGASASGACHYRAYHAGKGERAHLFEESLGRFEFRTVRAGGGWKLTWLEEVNMITLGSADAWGATPDMSVFTVREAETA